MSSGKCMELSQHTKNHDVVPHSRPPMYSLCRNMIKLVILIFVLSMTVGWGRSLYAAPLAQSTTVAVVGSGGATLYMSPGGETVAEFTPSTVVTAVGRSGDNQWVVVQNSSGQSGWLEVQKITIFGLEELPVMLEEVNTPVAATSAPAVQSTPTPAIAPTPSPVATLVAVVAVTSDSLGGGQVQQRSTLAVVRGGGAGLYDQPDGTQFEELASGTALFASGRSADGEWLMVTAPSGSVGWVQSVAVVVSNPDSLPIMDPATVPAAAVGSGSANESAPVAQPVPTSEATVETASSPGNAVSSTDPNKIVATVSLTDSRLNIRSGPGTDYLVIGQALPNDTFEVNGRNEAATWINIVAPKVTGGVGWVSADYVTLNQPILSIPVTETVAPAASPATTVAVGDIGCTTNQIIKWDDSLGKWVCSDDLIVLQAEVAALQAEVAALQAEIMALK